MVETGVGSPTTSPQRLVAPLQTQVGGKLTINDTLVDKDMDKHGDPQSSADHSNLFGGQSSSQIKETESLLLMSGEKQRTVLLQFMQEQFVQEADILAPTTLIPVKLYYD